MSGEMQAKAVAELPLLPLGEATAQDIQLEIIRRWRFNDFNGPRVAAASPGINSLPSTRFRRYHRRKPRSRYVMIGKKRNACVVNLRVGQEVIDKLR